MHRRLDASSAVYAEAYTGWDRSYWNWWKTTSCQQLYTHTDADFYNFIFCGAVPTCTHYRNVWLQGGYQGGYGGNVDSISATGGCTNLLHWSIRVVKEWSN